MNQNNNNVPAIQQTKEISPSERFTNAVIKEFSTNNGDVALSPFQKKLCQNYFIKIDMILKDAELKRMSKNERYREPNPYTWNNVNLQKLATDVIIYSSIGLDPTQNNHINPIPYQNRRSNLYDIAFIMGYKGTELKAKKYGLDIPDDVVVELVYQKDKFKPLKKDLNNKVESYIFEMSEDFDRGEIVGGFYYHSWKDHPERNKLKTFSKKDIDKRRPDKGSPEFWGGKKDIWENGKKVGTEEVEGWYDEMAYKTIYRAAYNSITIDSEKIDSNYLAIVLRETEKVDNQVASEIADHANKKVMEIQQPDIPVQKPSAPDADYIPEETHEFEGEQGNLFSNNNGGPGF